MMRMSKWSLSIVLLLIVAVTANAAPQEARASVQQEKVFQGSLIKIDAAARMISAKGQDNEEWEFSYTDKTEVVGADKTQGLAGKPGSKLRITYTIQRGINQATRIEMSE